jgi:hypothetical protein
VGKSEIVVVRVPRGITVVLWMAVSAAMVALIYALSGRAYVQDRATIIPEMGEPVAALATSAPIVADILFFLPWGALAYLALDRENSSRLRTYIATMVVGAAFALVLTAWQRSLPTRVTGWIDAIWYAAGCLAGAAAGHARKRVRIRFE